MLAVAAGVAITGCAAGTPHDATLRPRALPETPAGQRTGEFLAAYNAGDSASLLRLAERSYEAGALSSAGGPEGVVRRFMEMHALYGPAALDSVVAASPHQLEAWLRGTRTSAWTMVRLSTDSAAPHGITRISIGRGFSPPFAASRLPRGLTAEAIGRRIDADVERMTAAGYFSGAVMVTRNDSVLLSRGYGYADERRALPIRPDTRFRIASLGKMFTAVAVLQLVDAGRLSMDDTVARVLPGVVDRVASRITIRHLLTHSSGLGELGPALDSVMSAAPSATEIARHFADTTLAFEPGTRWEYSNRGYVLLGAIIERVTGQNYYEYVRDRVFIPAGMTSTSFEAPAGTATPLSFFRALRDSEFHTQRAPVVSALDDRRGNPAGGAVSTVGDLTRFVRALDSGVLLRSETAARMTRNALVGPETRPWGLGVEVGGEGVSAEWGHHGGSVGVSARLIVLPGRRATIVVLSNFDTAATIAGDGIRDLLMAQ